MSAVGELPLASDTAALLGPGDSAQLGGGPAGAETVSMQTLTTICLDDLCDVTGGQSTGPNLPPGGYPTPTNSMTSTPFKPFDFKATSQYGSVVNNPGMPNTNGVVNGGGGGGKLNPLSPQPDLIY